MKKTILVQGRFIAMDGTLKVVCTFMNPFTESLRLCTLMIPDTEINRQKINNKVENYLHGVFNREKALILVTIFEF